MPDDKTQSPTPRQPQDLWASVADAWEVIGALEETLNDLVLEQSALLVALVKTLPDFAQEFERAYSAAVADQKKFDSELPLGVQRAIHQLRKPRT